MNKHTALLLLVLIALSACKRETQVTGEAFVVTQGAGNYKLGLVEVRAFPEETMKEFLESKKPEYEMAKKAVEDAQQCDSKYVPDCSQIFFDALDGQRSLYFANRPANWAAQTQTDSDGKFTLTLSKPGRYALMASAERVTGNLNNKYYWIVWLTADGKPKSITLSNDNQLASVSPAEIVPKR